MVFHSLSKRSSVPGLRSGFVAGDPALMRRVPALPHLPRLRDAGAHAAASVAAWQDDAHVASQPRAVPQQVRARAADAGAGARGRAPDGGFYLWPDVGGDDAAFTRGLYRRSRT